MRKGSLEQNLEESSFFSKTAESLIMGLDLTSAPSRNVEQRAGG